MIKNLFALDCARARHWQAPFLREREDYLAYLMRQGANARRLREVATGLIRVNRFMEITEPRTITLEEIEAAATRWSLDPEHKGRPRSSGAESAYRFSIEAQNWFRYQGWLDTPSKATTVFAFHLKAFIEDLRFAGRYCESTIRSYGDRVRLFLLWLGDRYNNISELSVRDVDGYLESKQAGGMRVRTLASMCQALRTFFRFAATRGWCEVRLAKGIRSPRIPKYEEAPRGPTWRDIRRLIRSANGMEPTQLREKAILLLFAIYGFRTIEVARLSLDDLDWRGEILTIRRAKGGKLQKFPLQYEVGEAVLQYLRFARPRCGCRNLFVTRNPPHRPIHPTVLNPVVRRRIKALGISSENMGPHALRHSCATQLLKKGTSLKEIADFLGHSDLKCVSIYAKYDTRSLRQVADFSLGGLR